MGFEIQKRYYSIPDLVIYLNIPEKTIRNWTSQGKIPFLKFGRSVRFDIKKIDKWIKEREVSCFKNQYN